MLCAVYSPPLPSSQTPNPTPLSPYPASCQNTTNIPNTFCNMDQYYQPPLPSTQTGTVDCTDVDACYTLYCEDYNAGVTKANQIMSIPYIISACLSPFLGGFVDRFGLRAVIATIAPAALIVVHSILGYAPTVDPIGPLVGQGLAYAGFAAVLWPSVPLVVDQRLIGLGYGVVTSIQNIGLASFPLIVAGIATSKVSLSVCQSVSLSVCQSVSLSVCQSVCLSVGSAFSIPFPFLSFPSLPSPLLPFPSLPFPFLPFPSLPSPSLSYPLFLFILRTVHPLTHSPPVHPLSIPLFIRGGTFPTAKTFLSPWPLWACW